MIYSIKRGILNLIHYFKVIFSLTDDTFINSLKLLHHQISIMKRELQSDTDSINWIEKMQDIETVLTLLQKQIRNDYFENLKLHVNKYPTEYIEISKGKYTLKEFRTEQEEEEDFNNIYKAETQSIEDLNKIFTIINNGFFYHEGIASW